MKKILPLFLVLISALASFTFYSCTESVTSTPIDPAALFNWSVQTSPYECYGITSLDANTYFTGTPGGLYRVTNGTPELFTVNSTVFKTISADAFDATYIVYGGRRVSDNIVQYMVYNSGTYTIYDAPHSAHFLYSPFISERGTFYVSRSDSAAYYKFNNGVFTEYKVAGLNAVYFAKFNGSTYAYSYDHTSAYFYKISEAGPVLLRTEPRDYSIYVLNTGMIKMENTINKISAFTESGWTPLTTLTFSDTDYLYFRGESTNNFNIVGRDSVKQIFAYNWNGSSLVKQTNVPAEANIVGSVFWAGSEYYGNTSFFMPLDVPAGQFQKIIRMSLK